MYFVANKFNAINKFISSNMLLYNTWYLLKNKFFNGLNISNNTFIEVILDLLRDRKQSSDNHKIILF